MPSLHKHVYVTIITYIHRRKRIFSTPGFFFRSILIYKHNIKVVILFVSIFSTYFLNVLTSFFIC